MKTEEAMKARRRREAKDVAIWLSSKLGKTVSMQPAPGQHHVSGVPPTISVEVWDAAQEEIAALTQSLNRMEEAKAFEMKVADCAMDGQRQEIARLVGENEKLTKALRLASKVLGYSIGLMGKPMLPGWDKETPELVAENEKLTHRLENQARTIKVMEGTIARLRDKADMPSAASTSPAEPPLGDSGCGGGGECNPAAEKGRDQ